METDASKQSPNAGQQKPLSKLLVESKHVEILVKESAQELSSVNAGIKEELAMQGPLPGVENALEKSEAVEDKVQEASEKLGAVNRALKDEVQERHVLERELEEVTERGKVDRRAALHDLLTGLPNRALFYDRLDHGFQQASRRGWTFALMFVDLDDFKIINDTYGHDAGDTILQTIAQRLTENTRGDDTVSRHGGDEFLILINEVREEKSISLVAENLIKKIQEPCPISASDPALSLTIMASLGISIFPKDGVTAEALIASADRAMYVAKRNKSRYCFAGTLAE